MSESSSPAYFPILGDQVVPIDEKGRVRFPKEFRDALGPKFTMAIAENGQCAVCYPRETVLDLTRRVMSLSGLNPWRQRYLELLMEGADTGVEFDAQGRIVVPQRLRKVAGLPERARADVMLLGNFDRIYLWSAERYQHYQSEPSKFGHQRLLELEDLARKVGGIA